MTGIHSYGIPSRQELLLFDDMIVVHPGFAGTRTAAELEWLESKSLIRTVTPATLLNIDAQGQFDRRLITEERAQLIVQECRAFGENNPSERLETMVRGFLRVQREEPVDHPANDHWYNSCTRIMSAILRHAYSLNAVGVLREDRAKRPGYTGYTSRVPYMAPRRRLPEELERLLPPDPPEPLVETVSGLRSPGLTRNEQIFEIVLSQLPIPSETTAWEDIIEFRLDPATRLRFLELQRWIAKMLRQDISVKEIGDELEQLTLQYRAHMHKHRIRTGVGMLRVFLTFGAGVIENVMKFKLKDLIDLPFQVSDRIIALKDARDNAPGKEVSYIESAYERFRT